MANQLYGYNPSSDRGIGSPMLFSQSDALRFSSSSARVPGICVTQTSWPGVDVGAASSDPLVSGIKRPSESLYHQTLLGVHNAFGQSEAWFSSNPLTKCLRYESASNLPIYPQRPGEKDCAHYMLTRTCKFGDSCKFDHPIWVPEGGIPDWKEVFATDSEKLSGSILLYESKLVPLIATSESLPERPGEPDCPYFLKTQRCKFGLRCKFNHPKDKMVPSDSQENVGYSTLPERPSEPPCVFYVKTGKCKFGATCKFHYPKDIQLPSAGQDNGSDAHIETAISNDGNTGELKLTQPLFTPALIHNSKGLPIC
ncbi:zinc finger CCCH domain-containing protein 37-like [Actinidia eriantha]|uniref:zinc finger CCCH domain-containing protein 37-like n=1 Tax=Actinidia eriantha TaxID=165200 RepID=UPI002586BFD1|nr:zinc finger CCCH domain-containing protein 37-like [Actinidia eriantha]